jgi:hypothetical protein
MAALPPELWIVILDMVIAEGIIQLDQCDHITFPYDHDFLARGRGPYLFYRSYHRLCLVCRSFNAMLGAGPHGFLHPSSFPFPTSIKALRITDFTASYESVFRQQIFTIFSALAREGLSPMSSASPSGFIIMNLGDGNCRSGLSYAGHSRN